MTVTISGTSGGIGVVGSGTAQNSTSGTSIDFTGIPAGAKRITVMLNGVSTSGAANYWVQLGSGSVQTTGYSSQASVGTSTTGQKTGGLVVATNIAAANVHSGIVTLALLGGNTWVMSAVVGAEVTNLGSTAIGRVTLAGALDRVRLTTENGTDTFDAGSINILYE